MSIEAPITKVINIILAAQENQPSYIAQALDKVKTNLQKNLSKFDIIRLLTFWRQAEVPISSLQNWSMSGRNMEEIQILDWTFLGLFLQWVFLETLNQVLIGNKMWT